MFKILFLIFTACIFFISCKKEVKTVDKTNTQLYPLTKGNLWIYVDSFFDESQSYVGKDTFYLIASDTFTVNNHVYTALVDQYYDTVFTLRSDDSTVFTLEKPGESMMFSFPENDTQTFIFNSYFGDLLNSTIYTRQYTTTNYPSYKILITQNDGIWYHYKQKEFFFSFGLGIIKGRDFRKTDTGDFYYYDSYNLITYSLK